MDLRLAAAALLLLAGGAVAREAERRRATPRPADGPAALLGGFAAVAAQAVWLRADRAVQEHDEDRAMVLLRALVDLEPQVVSAAAHAAQEIGWNMVQGRTDPEVRWSLAREGVRILDDCVARNPGSADAHRGRADFLFRRLATDADLTARFAASHDPRGPVRAARADYGAALTLAPDDAEAAGGLAVSAGRLALAAADAGRWAEAAEELRASVRGLDAVLAGAAAAPSIRAEEDPQVAAVREQREVAAALLDVAEAPAGERPARLEAFRRARPGVLR